MVTTKTKQERMAYIKTMLEKDSNIKEMAARLIYELFEEDGSLEKIDKIIELDKKIEVTKGKIDETNQAVENLLNPKSD